MDTEKPVHNRDRQITVRLNSNELNTIHRGADAAGIRQSEFIRNAAMDAARKAINGTN